MYSYFRNEDLNANAYFNNLNKQPRDHMVFNQFGGNLGGALKKNKLFVFLSAEIFELPQTYTEPTVTVLTPEAAAGNFRYRDTAGTVRTVNPLTGVETRGPVARYPVGTPLLQTPFVYVGGWRAAPWARVLNARKCSAAGVWER